MMRLENKVAIISGGSRGMGAVEAELFVQQGAKVLVGDVRDDEGRALAEKIGADAVYAHLDVTSEDDWAAAVKKATNRYGKLDILVNNAGVSARGTIEETTVEDWDRVMGINAKGVFLGTRAAIPEMRKAGGGSIVNISSQLGLVGMAESSPQYQSSKGAVRIFTKSAAIQYAPEGIRVNSVHPGPIVTPMTEARRSDLAMQQVMVTRIPLGRYGESEDVAYGVLYLASDESSFVTGGELVIDGGWTAQ
jgi:NAD(P)-dependent dehydrogenase (short-subunit alcohol dehydrogenase family)